MITEYNIDDDFMTVPRPPSPPPGPQQEDATTSSNGVLTDTTTTATSKTKKRKSSAAPTTTRERLEKKLRKRGPSVPKRDADGGLVVKPTKRGVRQKTASEKHLKHTRGSKVVDKQKRSKSRTKAKARDDAEEGEALSSADEASSESDNEDKESMATEADNDEDSLSSASERRSARSRVEKRKKKQLESSKGGGGDLRKSVSLYARGEMVEAAKQRADQASRAAAKARSSDALALELFNSMKKSGAICHDVKIETFSKLMIEHPEAATVPEPKKQSASTAGSKRPKDTDKDSPIPNVPFTLPLIQAISNTSLAVPALERYGDALTPSQMAEQLAQGRLACPLLKTTDVSALLAEAGSYRTASGRILTFPGCIQGVHCQGKVAPIEGLVELPLKDRPLLMGFIYEHELRAYLQCQAELPTDRKCVLCLGVDFGSTLLAISGYSYKIHVEEMALMQMYRVPVDGPGGYHRSCVYVPESKDYRFDPFPRVDTSFYVARRDPSKMLIIGPDKTRPRWIIDDSSTHYMPPQTQSTPAKKTDASSSSSSRANVGPSSSVSGVYLVYSEIEITQPEKQKAVKTREEKLINSKEKTRGKYRLRQTEREKAIKDNYAHSGESSRMRMVRCASMRHADRVLDILPVFTARMDSGTAPWIASFRSLFVAPEDMHQAHTATVSTLRLIPAEKFMSVVPTLCVNILSASGSRCNVGTDEFTKDRIATLLLTHLCPRKTESLHCSLLVQVVRLTVLELLIDMIHTYMASLGEKSADPCVARSYNVIVYHLQCMVDSLWHVPYYVCEMAVRFERHREDPTSVHEVYAKTSDLYRYLERACVPSMNATNPVVACDRTIPYVSEFEKIYSRTHEKGKILPAEHLFRKIILTRNNRRKFATVIWNYAELDEWFKDMVVRIVMAGVLGNYACIVKRRPDRRIPLQARFLMYKMYSAIMRGQQGEEFYKWVFMGMLHLAFYTTHMQSLSRIVHHPALERHCRGMFNVDKYHRVVENAVAYASEQFLQRVLSKPEVLSVHCLAKTPIPKMGTIATELDTLVKKECESMFLGLVHHKTVHAFLASLREHTREHPTVVWDHPRTSVRLHPYLESLGLGPAAFCVLEYALEPGCEPHNTTGIDTLTDGDAAIEENAINGGNPFPPPVKVSTECTQERFEKLLQTRIPVRYLHLALLRKAIRTLHPLDRFPERHLLNLMPVLGCCKKAIGLVREAITCHEVDDKSAKKAAIETLRVDHPFSYSIVQVYAELWRVHETAFTVPLPKHYFDAQVQAIRDRFHVPPGGSLPDAATHVLFCHCCGCTTTLIRDEETTKRLDPNALTSESAANDMHRIVLSKRSWDHGTVQTFTKLPRSSEGDPTIHCVDEKIYLGEKCGQRPLVGILLLGKALVFRKHLITLCTGRGCGRPCVIAPKICEYGQMGYLCSVCSQIKRRTGADPTVTLVKPRIPLPEIPADSATAAPRKYYYTNTRREIAEKKEILKKRKAAVVVCDACGADTDRPRVMTITQEAGLCAPDGSDNGMPVRTLSSTITLTVCGMHHHNAPQYDMKKVYIEKVLNPDCQKAGVCTCAATVGTRRRTCTGMWTREGVIRLMNSLDRSHKSVVESRSIRKTLKNFKARNASAATAASTKTKRRRVG